jgi:Integrase core domain
MATVDIWIQRENRAWDVCPSLPMDRVTSAGTTPVGPLKLVALHSPVTGMSRTASVNRLIAGDALVLRRYTKNWRAPDDRKVNPWDLNEPDPTVIAAVKATRIIPKRTSFRSPWQNGIAERWVGSCRRDLLDHMVALSERHLKRLLLEYVRYHHENRTHLGLEKGTPDGRIRSAASGQVLSQERLGGLHHRYNRGA